MSLTQSQLIEELASQLEAVSKKQVKTLLEALTAIAYREAKNGFTIPGLGKLVLVHRKARMGRNPATGESIKIGGRTRFLNRSSGARRFIWKRHKFSDFCVPN